MRIYFFDKLIFQFQNHLLNLYFFEKLLCEHLEIDQNLKIHVPKKTNPINKLVINLNSIYNQYPNYNKIIPVPNPLI